MSVRVIYFAAARELAACSSEDITLPHATIPLPDFVRLLANRQPRLATYLSRMRFALNGEFASSDAVVCEGDEISVLPPVAGGSVLAEVRDDVLSLDEVLAAVRHPSAGAVAMFLGIVRDHHQGSPVARLDYEAYRELADKELRRIVSELMESERDAKLAALHRVGALEVGEVAVIVAASSPHRELAFRLCREAIDRIKASVPIWKKEWSPDGSALWVNLDGDERK